MTSRTIVMGRIVVPYGIKGWLKIQPFTLEADTLLEYQEWLLQRPSTSETTSVTVLEGRQHGEFLVVRFAGVDNREDAAKLRGMQIIVPRSELPELEPGEYYCSDLVGLAVINRQNVTLGTVRAVQDYGAHPVLHITPTDAQRSEILIPYVDAYVDEVVMAENLIRVDYQPEWSA